ncbi:MAG: aspartate-semialdehyde dehydrogenase [Peptostreptococcaceae bacterium]|nr:aspartate-semialdehyde dehydrogenase [Peptostreptococcaceae bacterium]
MKEPIIAIAGATGMVGNTILKVLEERNFPFSKLVLLAHPSEAGTKIMFKGKEYIVAALNENSFDEHIDIALFSAGGSVSEKFAPIAASKGTIVVDNSSAFRMDPEVPLVVPEVNPEDVKWNKGIIANPNCSTIQAVVALKPLHDKYKIKRIVYNTYQAVSGSGIRGVQELEEGLKGNNLCQVYHYPIAGNCIPQIDVFEQNGYTKEEMKMVNETRKILNADNLLITATAVRVPVFYCHSESINVEFENPVDVEEAKEVLKKANGIKLCDDLAKNIYPTANEVAGSNEVFVGRIRKDESVINGLNIWVVADNVRKGAATNAVQIAEILIKGDN